MGNSIAYEDDGTDEEAELTMTVYPEVMGEYLNVAIRSLVNESLPDIERPVSTEMPVIRKKPDLRTFRHTMLYKEIKALCALPANSNRPNDRWSLTRGLLKRENGIASSRTGAFTSNQQRRVANLFVPNQKEKRLMSLDAKVFVCKFNKDGSKLLTASKDLVIRIYDSSKGVYHRIKRITAEDASWSVLDVDFSPCGKYFAYSTWSEHFLLAPLDGNEDDFQWYNLNIDQHRAGIFAIRFSPCGRTLIGGCTNSCVYIADRESRAVNYIQTQNNHSLDINAVSFVCDQDSNVFATGCNKGIVKLWDMRLSGTSTARRNDGGRSASGRNSNGSSSSGSNSSNNRHTPVGVFIGHLDGITYIDPRNDGHYILTNSKDQSIKIWDLRMPTPNNKVHASQLPAIDWDYRWHTVPRDYYNPKTTLDGDVSVMTYRGHRVTKSLLRAKFSPAVQTGQRYIYTGCSTGRIIIYDVLTGQIREAIEGHKDIVRDLAWHPVRPEIVSSSWDTHVNLNTFKRNPLLKRSNSGAGYHGPLRRSRRIAHQNGELDDDDDYEDERPW